VAIPSSAASTPPRAEGSVLHRHPRVFVAGCDSPPAPTSNVLRTPLCAWVARCGPNPPEGELFRPTAALAASGRPPLAAGASAGYCAGPRRFVPRRAEPPASLAHDAKSPCGSCRPCLVHDTPGCSSPYLPRSRRRGPPPPTPFAEAVRMSVGLCDRPPSTRRSAGGPDAVRLGAFAPPAARADRRAWP